MSQRTLYIMLFTATIIAGLRIAGITEPPFRDIAHLYVGMVFGMAFRDSFRKKCLAVGGLLCIVEIIMFIVKKL